MSGRFLVIFLLLSGQGFGQYTQEETLKDFTTNHIAKWEIPIKNLADSPELQNNDSLLLTYCNLLYGITGFYIAEKNEKSDIVLSQFFDAIALLKTKPNLTSYYQTYSAAAIAYDMALRPYKIPFSAGKSFSLAYAAVKTNPENPTAWVILGNAKYHAPALFGGNMTEALKFFNTATTLWEHNRKTQNNWLYINTLAWQGFINYKLGNYQVAKAIYTKVLRMAPDFFWVKNELLPDVGQKQ